MSDSSYDIDSLQRENPHERDDRVLFEESSHTYTIDGDADYTSVTTLIHTHFAAFDADSVISKMRKSWKWPMPVRIQKPLSYIITCEVFEESVHSPLHHCALPRLHDLLCWDQRTPCHAPVASKHGW